MKQLKLKAKKQRDQGAVAAIQLQSLRACDMRCANGTNYSPESTADGLDAQWKRRGGKKQLQREVKSAQKKEKSKQFRGIFLGIWDFSLLIAICLLARQVEVSGWIAGMQEFMSVILRGAIQAIPGPIKCSQ